MQRVIISDNKGAVYIYDNTAGNGTVISFLDTAQGANPMGSVEFGVPFSNGLTIVTSGDIFATIVYE